MYVIFVVFQLLSHVRLFVTPGTAARQAPLSFTIPRSLLKLMSMYVYLHTYIHTLPSPSIKCDSCVQTGFHSDPVPTAKSMYVWPCYLCMALFPS